MACRLAYSVFPWIYTGGVDAGSGFRFPGYRLLNLLHTAWNRRPSPEL